MKIKTQRPVENQDRRSGPAPSKTRRSQKKTTRKLGQARISGRQILSILRILGIYGGMVLIAIVIVFLSMKLYRSDKFVLGEITFHGCKELDPQKLEQLIRRNVPPNTLRIELPALKSLLEQEKWVKQVQIRRILPSELIITVRERIPSVVFELQGELMIADDEGILLDTYNPKYGKLDVPVFKGIVGKDAASYGMYQEENTARIRHALNMLSEMGAESPRYTHEISEIDISDRNNLKIMLVDSTAEIFLGKENYLNRIRTLLNSDKYREFKNQNLNFTEIDLRFDDKIIFRGNRDVSDTPAKGGESIRSPH